MYGQVQPQQSVIQPHHAQALHVLPQQFPPFFSGFAPQSFSGVTVMDMQVPAVVSLLLMRYIIQNANNNTFSMAMYQTMSVRDFANPDFLKLVTTGNCIFNTMTRCQFDQNKAFETATHIPCSQWIVNYANANWNYMNPGATEQEIYNRAKQVIDNFEAAVAQRQGAAQPGGHPMGGGMAPQTIQASTTGVYGAQQPATPGAISPVVMPALRDFNEGYLSSPLMEFDEPEPPAPVHQPVDNNTNEIVMNAATSVQKEPVMQKAPDINYRGHDVAPILDIRRQGYVLVDNKLTIVQTDKDGERVDYNMHKKARLFNDGRAWGLTSLDTEESDNSISAITALDKVPLLTEELGEDVVILGDDTVDSGSLAFQPVLIDATECDNATIRYELSKMMTATSNAAACCFETSKQWHTIEQKYIDSLAEATDVQSVVETLALSFKATDQSLRATCYDIDRMLTRRVYEIMNFELGIRGNLDSFTADILDIINYVKKDVNDRSYEYLMAEIMNRFKWIVGGLIKGTSDSVRLAVLTRATSQQFPFLIAGDCGEVNEHHTPQLHKACVSLANMTTVVTGPIHEIVIYTIDGVKIRLIKTAFGDKFVLIRE